MKLSAVVITRNEEENLERSLKSLELADEIIVIDDDSIDSTESKARKFNAGFIKRKLGGDFSNQRNFGLNKANGEWILFLDADEELSPELTKEIKVLINNNKNECQAYKIKRRDFFWNKEMRYGEISKARTEGIIRLVKKDGGEWRGRVHEEYFVFKGEVGKLKSYMNHYPHKTVREFIEEVNYYSTLRAKELYSAGKSPSIIGILFFPSGKFIYNYFIKLGFLDGPEGFVYSFMMSFHSFLVRSKLYQYKKVEL